MSTHGTAGTALGQDPGRRIFDALFAPQAIALVGASSDASKNTARPQRMLREHGYQGRILPINPRRSEIFGETAYPTLLDAPGSIDQAFIMVPAKDVLQAVEHCVERQVAVATIYTDGFAETGDGGRALQERIVETARAGGVRILGPNCSGIYSTDPSCAMSVNSAIERLTVTPGPLAIISQSGSMTGGLVSRGLGRGVGFSRIVSIGNEADLGIGELVDALVEDDATGAVLLFVETIRDAHRLASSARRMAAAGKPVLAYKLGRSELGRDLAASHTGAMVGSDDAVDAFFRANGILRVNNLETLFELPVLVMGQRPARRHRVALMSTTGGGAGLVADNLGVAGIEVVPPTAEVVEKLAARGIKISTSRVTDLTHAGTRADVYGPVLEELLASDHCDLVVAVAGSSAQFQPEITVQPVVEANRAGKPLAMFIAPHAPESLALLSDAGVAGFRTPESCVDAVRAWANWRDPSDIEPVNRAKQAEVEAVLGSLPDGRFDEREASRLLGALGIPFAESHVIKKFDEPVVTEFPVVVKILSPDVPHKTDSGGVELGIANATELKDAASRILERVASAVPEARIEGLLVQRMESGLAEAILGFRRDQQVGPVVVLGVGGVLAEAYRDFSVRCAPVGRDEALAMINEVTGLTVLSGFRGMPLGDTEALVEAIVSMSQLAMIEGWRVHEAEVNPLLIRAQGEGVVAVDGLVVAERVRA